MPKISAMVAAVVFCTGVSGGLAEAAGEVMVGGSGSLPGRLGRSPGQVARWCPNS